MKRQIEKHPYRVKIGNEALNFKTYRLDDPIVLGRQLIELTGAKPVDQHSLVAMLSNGDFEDLRLDEKFDLSARGCEKFLVARSDRSFKFRIDDRELEWPYACITGFKLKKIASLSEGYSLWIEKRGGQDREIFDDEVVDLGQLGVERFYSHEAKQICVFVNSRERLVSPGRISFKALVDLAFPNAAPGPNTSYTVSFYKGSGDDPEGTLIKGEHVLLKKGMVFNVSETDKS